MNTLGTTFTQSNSFKVARKHLQKKASKAMFTFLRHINTREGAKPKTIIKLFNSLSNQDSFTTVK